MFVKSHLSLCQELERDLANRKEGIEENDKRFAEMKTDKDAQQNKRK